MDSWFLEIDSDWLVSALLDNFFVRSINVKSWTRITLRRREIVFVFVKGDVMMSRGQFFFFFFRNLPYVYLVPRVRNLLFKFCFLFLLALIFSFFLSRIENVTLAEKVRLWIEKFVQIGAYLDLSIFLIHFLNTKGPLCSIP